MACKVYAHLDFDGLPAFTLPVEAQRPAEVSFGAVKQALLERFSASHPEEKPLEQDSCCFWNGDSFPVADRAPLALHLWDHNDFFLRPLPTDAAAASALTASQQQRGELSYYYAHDRQTAGATAPAAGPAAAADRRPLAAAPAAVGGFNSKQSPFGTDITGYESITSYTWEDKDGDTVKVLVLLDGVGKLPPESIRSSFSVRAFELLIDDYDGKKLRFACYKTHGEMKPEECRHVVRANRINLVLKKAKEKDVWFDLFKKRAIGDDDDP